MKTIDVAGRVVDDSTGDPIANATLRLESSYTTGVMHYHREKMSTETDDQGRFFFSGLKVRTTPYYATGGTIQTTHDDFDKTTAYLTSANDFRTDLEIRLQTPFPQPLPVGCLEFAEVAKLENEPSLRFLFQDDQLYLVTAGQEADFELHYRFKPEGVNNWNPGLGSAITSKSGKWQYLDSVTTTGNRIGQVFYRESLGHPPRLPDLKHLVLRDSCSFDHKQPVSSKHFVKHEYLLKTRTGNYALLQFFADEVRWLLQPDGSLNLRRNQRYTPSL